MDSVSEVQRIGLFGGAFDPPHLAHEALACAVIEQLHLDRLHIVPTGDAWHKARSLSAGAHRLRMCQLAFGKYPQVVLDDRELRRDGPTYTVDTLRELKTIYPTAQLYLQIGADQAAAFHIWRQVDDIVRMAQICIALRASPDAEMTLNLDDPLPGCPVDLTRVKILTLPTMAHSATEIRRRVAMGQSIAHLVKPAVAGYIADHHLYQ